MFIRVVGRRYLNDKIIQSIGHWGRIVVVTTSVAEFDTRLEFESVEDARLEWERLQRAWSHPHIVSENVCHVARLGATEQALRDWKDLVNPPKRPRRD